MTQTSFESLEVVTIQMVRERQILYNGNRVTTPEKAAEAYVALLGVPDKEVFVACHVDTKLRINSISVISQGTLNQALVHPREVFKPAILANAASIILMHNHPSEDLSPSNEDKEITKRIKEAGEILGIKVLDHLIINCENGTCNSMLELGLM